MTDTQDSNADDQQDSADSRDQSGEVMDASDELLEVQAELVVIGDTDVVETADDGRADVIHHAVYLGMALIVFALSFVLRIEEIDSREYVFIPWMSQPVPEACTMKRMFKLDCPGCGLTRSFISLSHLKLWRSLEYNPAGIACYLVMLFQLVMRPIQIWRLKAGQPELKVMAHSTWWIVAIAVLLVGQWLYSLIW